MGRNTFEKVLSFGQWPYEGKRVVVMTRTLSAVPESMKGKVELFAGTPGALIEKMKAEKESHLYIDGGQVIQSFLRAGLIDEIVVSILPILLGTGIPLFGPLDADMPLEHTRTKVYGSGMVQSKYLLRK